MIPPLIDTPYWIIFKFLIFPVNMILSIPCTVLVIKLIINSLLHISFIWQCYLDLWYLGHSPSEPCQWPIKLLPPTAWLTLYQSATLISTFLLHSSRAQLVGFRQDHSLRAPKPQPASTCCMVSPDPITRYATWSTLMQTWDTQTVFEESNRYIYWFFKSFLDQI